MIKTIFFAVAFLVLCAKIHVSEGNIPLGSCSLSCNENEDHAHDLIGSRGGLQGPPGKRGPVGQKGERGIKGGIGGKGGIGAKGVPGIKGESGVKGDRGMKGNIGQKGDIGVKGDPGVKGESGIKGDHGIKGDTGVQGQLGPRGVPGSSCDCSRNDELATQMATLQQELNDLKGRVRLAPEGWSRASNNRWYKVFKHESVNYETAKSRCAVFGAKLACAGLRTAAIRSEIKRLPPTPLTHTWIGLDDLVSRGNYVWADGVLSTSSNTDWDPGQPNHSAQRCGMMYGSYNGRLHDQPCTLRFHYLCEL